MMRLYSYLCIPGFAFSLSEYVFTYCISFQKVTKAKVSQYYLDRGADHAYVEFLSQSHVASALHALETKIVAAFAGQSSSSGSNTGRSVGGGSGRGFTATSVSHDRYEHHNSSQSSHSGHSSSSHYSVRMRNAARQVYALTREASRQRWPRAGAMLYLRHRAFAAAVAARYPAATATAFSTFMGADDGRSGGSSLFPDTAADDARHHRRTTILPTHLRPAGIYTHVLVIEKE